MAKKKKGKKQKGRGSAVVQQQDGTVDIWTQKLESKLESEVINSEPNPYFSYDRCPRYTRLYTIANDRNIAAVRDALDLAVKTSHKPYMTVWREVVKDHLKRWDAEREHLDKNDKTMWYLTANAEEIRTLPKEEARRDGYTYALVIINGKQALTVGSSIPIEGESEKHWTAFVCEYEDAHLAWKGDAAEGAGHEGEDGVIGVRTINDDSAVIVQGLAKVAQKRLMACALLDRALEGHLCLHTEVSSKLDELRRAFVQLERHPTMYRSYLDILEDRVTGIVKNALEAQRCGALNIEDYVRSKAGDYGPDSSGTYRIIGGRLYPLEILDTTPGTIRGTEDGLTEEERDRGWEVIDGGEKVEAHLGMDLLRAVSTGIGPLRHRSRFPPKQRGASTGQDQAEKDAALDDDVIRRDSGLRSYVQEQVPLGWLEHTLWDGRDYFRNINAGTSHWKIPESAFIVEHAPATQAVLDRARQLCTQPDEKPKDNPPSHLHLAAWHGHESAVTRLISGEFAGAVDPTMLRGLSPLHLAAQNGHKVVVNLLSSNGADVNRQTKEGSTALWAAAYRGDTTIVRFLLDLGADASITPYPTETIDREEDESEDKEDLSSTFQEDLRQGTCNMTPLEVAIFKGHPDVVALLEDRFSSKADSSGLDLVPEEPDPIPEEPDPIPEEPDPVPEELDPVPEELDPVPEEPDPAPEKPNPVPGA